MKEQKKFQELYEGSVPKVKLADELSVAVQAYYDAEVDGLSDEQKALIPDGAPHTKLAWLKKAKAAGVFGKQTPAPAGTFNGKPKNGLPPEKWYLELDSSDERFSTLTGSQYQEWKAHNKAPANAPMRGGF